MSRTLSISNIALLVHDYDEAIAFYCDILGFTLQEDTRLSDSKRWVRLGLPGNSSTCLLLAKASDELQKQAVGNQAGGRVFLFLNTDDFWRDYQAMQAKGVQFLEAPREEAYATVVVFQDLYGTKWDLLQPKA